MAYAVNFGIIDKKVNSTSQAFTVNNSASCNLKEPCDVLNPTFTFASQDGFNVKNNYFYVADFGRYYWITAITFVLGHWEITGKVDVLASFKAEIGAQEQFITRSSAKVDGRVPDSYAIAKANPYITPRTGSMEFDSFGCYVICVAGAAGNKYYMMRGATWELLCTEIFSSGFLQSYYNAWDAIVQDVTNAVLNPADYILSAIWLPVYQSGSYENITLGFLQTSIPGYAVQAGTVIKTKVFDWTIPNHFQSAYYGYYLNSPPYRKISLFLPGYGNITIDADLTATANRIYIQAEIDIAGTLTYAVSVKAGDGTTLWMTSLVCDISTPVGFASQKSGITSALTAIGSGFASGGVGGAIASGVGSALNGAIPQIERASTGGSRSILATDGLVVLTIEDYEIIPPAVNRYGWALGEYNTPATYPGYLQCSNASVSCPGTQSEIEEINAFLNGGFYYE